jgi:hypothetical protein
MSVPRQQEVFGVWHPDVRFRRYTGHQRVEDGHRYPEVRYRAESGQRINGARCLSLAKTGLIEINSIDNFPVGIFASHFAIPK